VGVRMTMFGVKARSMCALAVGVALGVALRPEPAAAWGVKRSGKTWAKPLPGARGLPIADQRAAGQSQPAHPSAGTAGRAIDSKVGGILVLC
jgi:hypothetical protein